MKNYKGRHNRKHSKKKHAVFPENQLASHNYPEIERRFVGVVSAMVCKSEDGTGPQRFIGDAQVPQFVSQGEIAKNTNRQDGQDKKAVYNRLKF